MRTRSSCLAVFVVGTLLSSPRAAEPAVAPGAIHSVRVDDITINLWLPPGLPIVRGVVVKPADQAVTEKEGPWQAAIRSWGFGEIGMSLDDSSKSGGRETRLAKALPVALKNLAEKTGHAELEHVPFVALGMSRGGGWSTAMCRLNPDRAIGYVSVCGWMGGDPAKADRSYLDIPGLFVIGSVPDGFKMLASIDDQYVPAMKQGDVRWTCALSWGAAHQWKPPTSAYCMTYLDQVIKLRLPEASAAAAGPVKLRSLSWEDGWAGDRGTWASACPTISSLKDLKGERENLVWQPNRYLAWVWRAYMTKEPAVVFEEPRPADPIASNAGRREYLVAADSEFPLVAKMPADARTVRFHDGDVLLGEADAAHPAFTWKVPAGTHAVIAIAEAADGTVRSSNVLWVVGSPRR